MDENGPEAKWDDENESCEKYNGFEPNPDTRSSTRFGSPAFVSGLDGFLPGRVEEFDKAGKLEQHADPEQHADEADEEVEGEGDKVAEADGKVEGEVDKVVVVVSASNFATKSACSFRLLAFCDPCLTVTNSAMSTLDFFSEGVSE